MDERVVGLVLADHHAIFAEGLGIILDAETDLAVLGVAHTVCRAVELVATYRPAVLLLDAQLAGTNPTQAVATVKAGSPTKVLIVSPDARQQTGKAAMAAGAGGVLAKHESSQQLIGAIRKLADSPSLPVLLDTE